VTNKSAFSEEEWKTILASPMLASTAVSMADPNGIWGVLQEGMASARALLDAKKDSNANELIKALVSEIETSEGREKAKQALKGELTAKTPSEVKAQALAGLGRVSQILAKAAPSDAAAFKTWLTQIAERVAESSTEGGFMGFGGVKVSNAEKASIAEISTALGVA
jgi:hypothetical protein